MHIKKFISFLEKLNKSELLQLMLIVQMIAGVFSISLFNFLPFLAGI